MDQFKTNSPRNGDGRAILITGSTRGIGLSAAARFLSGGGRVAIFCRHREHVDEALAELSKVSKAADSSEHILGLVGDVRKSDDIKRITNATLDSFGRIDVLINNAGVAVWKPTEETTEEEWDNIIDTNLKGSFLFMHYVLPVMRRQDSGVIINISSGLGVQGSANYSAYSASKFGLIGLTQVVADETGGTGIKVYAVLPGGVATRLHLDIHPWEDPDTMMTPEYIAEKIFDVARGKKRSGSSIEVYY